MENELVFSTTTHAYIGHLFSVALAAHVVGLLYFLAARDRIAPRFRTATLLSATVMAASGLVFFRLATSWDDAFVFDGTNMVPSDDRFDGGLRYVNWAVTVPVLLAQVLFAFDLARERVLKLRSILIVSGLAMVITGYVGQFRLGSDNTWALTWGAISTVPFVVLLVVLIPLLRQQSALIGGEAGKTLANLQYLFLFFWGLYPIAYLVPVFDFTTGTYAVAQTLFTAADLGSKVLYGVLLAKVLRLRSAAEGFVPALEVTEPELLPAGTTAPRP